MDTRQSYLAIIGFKYCFVCFIATENEQNYARDGHS